MIQPLRFGKGIQITTLHEHAQHLDINTTLKAHRIKPDQALIIQDTNSSSAHDITYIFSHNDIAEIQKRVAREKKHGLAEGITVTLGRQTISEKVGAYAAVAEKYMQEKLQNAGTLTFQNPKDAPKPSWLRGFATHIMPKVFKPDTLTPARALSTSSQVVTKGKNGKEVQYQKFSTQDTAPLFREVKYQAVQPDGSATETFGGLVHLVINLKRHTEQYGSMGKRLFSRSSN